MRQGVEGSSTPNSIKIQDTLVTSPLTEFFSFGVLTFFGGLVCFCWVFTGLNLFFGAATATPRLKPSRHRRSLSESASKADSSALLAACAWTTGGLCSELLSYIKWSMLYHDNLSSWVLWCFGIKFGLFWYILICWSHNHLLFFLIGYLDFGIFWLHHLIVVLNYYRIVLGPVDVCFVCFVGSKPLCGCWLKPKHPPIRKSTDSWLSGIVKTSNRMITFVFGFS